VKGRWTVRITLLANLGLVLLALNPWYREWSEHAFVVLALEAAALVIVGLPVTLFQVFVRKKTFRQAVADSIDAVMDFLPGAA